MNSFSEMNNLIINNSNSLFLNNSFDKKDSTLVTSNRESLLHNVNNDLDIDLSLKFNFDLEENDSKISNSSSCFSEDGEEYYDSFENKQQMEMAMYESIDNSFIKINMNDNYFNRSFQIRNDLRRNRNLKDFEYVSNSLTVNSRSSRLDESNFLGYINNSLYFFKQSYKYISNFNSL